MSINGNITIGSSDVIPSGKDSVTQYVAIINIAYMQRYALTVLTND